METQAPALAQAGQRLYDEAKEHMRSARYHRRRARALYEQAATVAEMCAAHGIQVAFEIPSTPESSPDLQGETSGNDRSTPDAA